MPRSDARPGRVSVDQTLPGRNHPARPTRKDQQPMLLMIDWLDQDGIRIDRTLIREVERGRPYDASTRGAASAHVLLDPHAQLDQDEPDESGPIELDDPLARFRSALGPISARAHTLVVRLAADWRADELATLATALETAIRTRSRSARMDGAAMLLDQPGLTGDARRVCEWLAEGGDPSARRDETER